MKGFAIIVSLFVSVPALAQDNGKLYIKLPPSLMQCLAACQVQALECAPTDQVAARSGSDCTQAKATATKKAIRKGPTLWKRYQNVSRQLSLLESSTKEALDEHRADIDALKEELEELQGQLEELGAGFTDLAAAHQALSDEVGKALDRLTAVESRMTVLTVGPTVGGLGLWSSDGSTFTSFSAGVRADFRFRPETHLVLESGLLMAASEQPFGATVRAGLGFDLSHGLAIETGVSGVFASLDSQLLAKSIFVTPDVGLGYRMDCGFHAELRFLVGAEFDASDPGFALGGQLTAGWAF